MVFRFFKVACACARHENGKQTQVQHPLFLLNCNVGWWFSLSPNSFSFPNLIFLLLYYPRTARKRSLHFERGRGDNMLRREGPACGSHVWLMRPIAKVHLWFRKHYHYSYSFNIPHGFGVRFLNTEWLLYKPFFHASLSITVVSKQTEAGPETPTQCYCSATVEVKLNTVIVWWYLSLP